MLNHARLAVEPLYRFEWLVSQRPVEVIAITTKLRSMSMRRLGTIGNVVPLVANEFASNAIKRDLFALALSERKMQVVVSLVYRCAISIVSIELPVRDAACAENRICIHAAPAF